MALARHYKVSEIKQKLLHPAQTSVYSVDILTKREVNDFVGVTLGKDSEIINLSCCEASLPGSSLATHESNNDYHGTSEKMVYRRIYDDTIDLTFYVDYKYSTLKYFLAWMSFIVGEGNYFTQDDYLNSTTFYRMTYPQSYKTKISLLKFEKDISSSSPNYRLGYDFIDAFPINLSSIPVSYEQSDLLKVTVSFSYTRYVIRSNFSPYRASAIVGAAPSTEIASQASQNSNLFGSNAISSSAFGSSAFGSNGIDLGTGIQSGQGPSVYTMPESLAPSFETNISLLDIQTQNAEAQSIAQAERNLINSPLASQEARRLLAGENVGGTTFSLF